MVFNELVADDDTEDHDRFKGNMKLRELKDFVDKFALGENEKKEERVIKSKQDTTMNKESDANGI